MQFSTLFSFLSNQNGLSKPLFCKFNEEPTLTSKYWDFVRDSTQAKEGFKGFFVLLCNEMSMVYFNKCIRTKSAFNFMRS